MGGGGAETITVCQNKNVKCGKIRKSNHMHTVKHGGTVNFSKYVYYILSTNPTTLILSYLVILILTKNPNLIFVGGTGWG